MYIVLVVRKGAMAIVILLHRTRVNQELVDFVFLLSQKQEQKEKEPSPKSTIRKKEVYYRLANWHID